MIALAGMVAVQMAFAVATVLALGRWRRARSPALLLVAGSLAPVVLFVPLAVVALLATLARHGFGAGEAVGGLLLLAPVAIPFNLLAALATWGNRLERWRD